MFGWGQAPRTRRLPRPAQRRLTRGAGCRVRVRWRPFRSRNGRRDDVGVSPARCTRGLTTGPRIWSPAAVRGSTGAREIGKRRSVNSSAMLIVLCGLSFSGQSTIGQSVARIFEAPVVSLDAINEVRGLQFATVPARRMACDRFYYRRAIRSRIRARGRTDDSNSSAIQPRKSHPSRCHRRRDQHAHRTL